MNSEQWKTIPDFPEYEVSDRGRVRRGVSLIRLDRTRVRLSQNGEQVRVNVTALVYSLFPERMDSGPLRQRRAMETNSRMGEHLRGI
jgi:hypothetical protein